MIIDVHSHCWDDRRHFNEDFRSQAQRAYGGAPVNLRISAEGCFCGCLPDTRAIVCGGKARLSGLWVDDHYVADYVAKHPDRLIGYLSVDPVQEGWEREMLEGTALPRLDEAQIEALIHRDALSRLGLEGGS